MNLYLAFLNLGKWLICLIALSFFGAETTMADSSLIRRYYIPDPNRPIPEDDRGMVGPSGELIPFLPDRIQADDVVGRRVDEIKSYVGTYGMGGPGFFGLRLGDEWLTVAIWSAGVWIRVANLLVVDSFHDNYGRPEPWISENGDRLSAKIVGSTVETIDIRPNSLAITFSNELLLSIDKSPDYRPIREGSKEPRVFVEGDDLRDVVFLSPTDEIWID